MGLGEIKVGNPRQEIGENFLLLGGGDFHGKRSLSTVRTLKGRNRDGGVGKRCRKGGKGTEGREKREKEKGAVLNTSSGGILFYRGTHSL